MSVWPFQAKTAERIPMKFRNEVKGISVADIGYLENLREAAGS